MKNRIKKIAKWILLVIGFIMVLLILFLLYSFVSHKLKSNKELKYLKNYDIGEIIEIDGKKVNYKIFNEDNKENTILLMGGSGATDLALSFEPLARNINAKIILINRPGYGFSSDTSKKADIDYIVSFYRRTLKELNISDKIVLMPHSISGIYAIYWAEFFPEEVESIIGLDIGSPYMYIEESNDTLLNTISFLGSKLGLHRYLYKQNAVNTAIKNYNIYEENYFQAIWYMNMINPYSKFNLSEENLLKENANKVITNLNDNYYSLKKLYILANSISGEYYEKYERENLNKYYKKEDEVQKYVENIKLRQENEKKSLELDDNTSFIEVEGPHMIYYYPTDTLINAINSFLEE